MGIGGAALLMCVCPGMMRCERCSRNKTEAMEGFFFFFLCHYKVSFGRAEAIKCVLWAFLMKCRVVWWKRTSHQRYRCCTGTESKFGNSNIRLTAAFLKWKFYHLKSRDVCLIFSFKKDLLPSHYCSRCHKRHLMFHSQKSALVSAFVTRIFTERIES